MRETYTVLCTYIKAVNIICFYIKFLYVSAHKRNSTARMCERVTLNISIFRTRKGSLPYYNYIFFPVALQPYRALADRAAAAGQRS